MDNPELEEKLNLIKDKCEKELTVSDAPVTHVMEYISTLEKALNVPYDQKIRHLFWKKQQELLKHLKERGWELGQ